MDTSIYFKITPNQYLSNNNKIPITTDQKIISNAKYLLESTKNLAKDVYEAIGFVFELSSGLRPTDYNIKIGGALKSTHITGEGIDILDPKSILDAFLVKNSNLLIKHSTYLEHPWHTPGWSHNQTRKTNNRIFIPSLGQPKHEDPLFKNLMLN